MPYGLTRLKQNTIISFALTHSLIALGRIVPSFGPLVLVTLQKR